MKIKVLGLSLYDQQAASTRYRLLQYIPGLSQNGIDLEVSSLLGSSYIKRTFSGNKYPLPFFFKDYCERLMVLLRQRKYDVAIVNGELFPLLPSLIESRLISIPYIYDFDDAFFIKYRMPRFKKISFLLKGKFNSTISRAANVLAGNHYLADYSRQWNPSTYYLPTVVDIQRYMPLSQKNDGIFTVGWIGSPSTSIYLSMLVEPMIRLAKEGPIRFVVIGGNINVIPGVEVINLPWNELTEIDMINKFDVGVMPLFDDEWTRGKCAFKLIQYMACGVPVVASPVGANIDVVDNRCGFLADSSDEWYVSLRRLRDEQRLKKSFGIYARSKIEESYSLQRNLPIMLNAIMEAVDKRSSN